jgi:hypothetical protein
VRRMLLVARLPRRICRKEGKNLFVVDRRFCWGFLKKRVLDVVFLWSVCGGSCGKDGRRMHAIFRPEIMQGIFHNFRASCMLGEVRLLLFDEPLFGLGQGVYCEVLAAAG